MAKTYTAGGTVAAGDVATAAAWNVLTVDVNNLIVPPLLRVHRATLQSIANNTDTFFTFTIEDFDTDGCFTPSSDTVTVQTTGVYYVSAGISWASNNTGYRAMYIMKNPSSVSDYASIFAGSQVSAASASDALLAASSVQTFTAGETIKVQVSQNSGGALNAGNVTLTGVSHLSLAWLGRTS